MSGHGINIENGTGTILCPRVKLSPTPTVMKIYTGSTNHYSKAQIVSYSKENNDIL